MLRKNGFTVIELLVVISVIALLVALAIPALSLTIRSTQETASLVKIRENLNLLLSAAAARGDRFLLAEPSSNALLSRPAGIIRLPDGSVATFDWFSQSRGWVLSMIRTGDEPDSAWLSPIQHESVRLPLGAKYALADYLLSHAAMASPQFFREGAMQRVDQCVAQRTALLRYPASKGLLIERSGTVRARSRGIGVNAEALSLPRPVAFGDGHVAIHRLAEGLRAVPNRFAANNSAPVMTTEGGLLGRDF